MAITHGYIDGEQLAAYMAATASGWDMSADVDRACETASRDIDAWCGRRFWADTTASQRTFRNADPDELFIDDAISITSMTVDGVTVDLNDVDLCPLNGVDAGIEGWPVTSIVRPAGGPALAGRILITAKWGWPAVPTPVTTACLQLAAEIMKLGEAPFGVAGLAGDGSVVRVGHLSPQVRGRLERLRTAAVIATVA